MKYDIKDFEEVVKGQRNIDDLCELYGVSHETLITAMNRKGYYLKKTKIKIISPHKTKVVYSYRACADELGVSEETIRNYLKGKRKWEERRLKMRLRCRNASTSGVKRHRWLTQLNLTKNTKAM